MVRTIKVKDLQNILCEAYLIGADKIEIHTKKDSIGTKKGAFDIVVENDYHYKYMTLDKKGNTLHSLTG